MIKRRILFTVALTLRTPILTKVAGALGFGLDAAMQRDSRGRPSLSGTLVKGNLRHAWEDLARISGKGAAFDIGHWLGEPSADGSFDAPDRGILRFGEWFSDLGWSAADQATPRFRISIDPETGGTATGMLQTIESPYVAGREVTFTGQAQAVLDRAQMEPLRRRIRQGLLFVPAVGALKGIGFGRVVKAEVSWKEVKPAKPMSRVWKDTTRVGLRVRPTGPFCFAKPALGEKNHFKSEDFIPGGALVAAIAARVAEAPGRWPHLDEELDCLHLTHARPAPTGAALRPIAIPLTLVKAGNGFHQLPADADTCLIDSEAPTFQTDWKGADWETAVQLCNPALSADLVRKLRIRNRIDPGTGKAQAGILFSAEVIETGWEPHSGAAAVEWLANLDLSCADEPAALLQELDDLLREPLSGLGKTEVDAQVVLETEPFPLTRPRVLSGQGFVSVYLQSPARLLPSRFQCTGTNGGKDLKAGYRDAWDKLSGGALELTGFLAHQRLFGGDYWWHRFRASQGESGYHSELLTLEGSVFRLRITDDNRARGLLNDWLARGLPQIDAGAGGDAWDCNPWIRANGFGEIALDLALSADTSGHDHE